MIRLRLAWGLGRRRRLSRKARFREQARTTKVSRRVFFRRTRRRHLTRLFWYNGFPHTAVSAKLRGARMGKGKPDPKVWAYMAKEGLPLLKVTGVRPVRLRYLLRRVSERLPGTALICYGGGEDLLMRERPGTGLWY